MSADHPWEIAPKSLQEAMQSESPPVVIDCREVSEVAIAMIVGTMHIPMGETKSRMPELEAHADAVVVVHCHHGVRSLQVVAFLRESGFDLAVSLAGGIDRWSTEIDRNIPRY
ncbi:MAG: rhodanese-like domain-containing protein [Planctomycetota bacterium]|nr:rhodanese-like domain-containing protein [Planctomycetota bacterium]MDA1026941.1 rhodanese-like domain-containing protein [Planctomycetota bacterium]